MRFFFSLIIPTLNEEHFLPLLLESLSQQSYKHFEVIVVDGGSKDKTVEKAQSFSKQLPHLKVLSLTDANLPKQRNKGAALAKGDWFLFIDADSVLYSYSLERMAAYLQNKDIELFTTWFSSDGMSVQDALISLLGNMMVEASLLFHRPWTPGAFTAVTKERFEAVGGYTETLSFHEDYDFGKKLKEKGLPLYIIRETLYIFSQRRLRREGKLKIINKNIQAAMYVLLTNRSLKFMPGYIMGGHLYDDTDQHPTSVLKSFRQRLSKLIDKDTKRNVRKKKSKL